VFLREQGILKRIRGTPLPSSAYFAGIAASAVTNAVAQVAVITVVGRVVFGVAWPAEWLALFVFLALGVVCFAALGVALAHAIPNVESAPAYVNAVFLPVIVISGVFYDADRAPAWLHDLCQALPLTHLIDGLSGAMVHHEGLADHVPGLLVLGGWAVVAVVLALRGFSWEARRD
jgi:ABC-2 type transport system permease protein